jgi:hypothetical protein
MKKKLNHDFMENLKELSVEETLAIKGGSDIWYWLGQAISNVSKILSGS